MKDSQEDLRYASVYAEAVHWEGLLGLSRSVEGETLSVLYGFLVSVFFVYCLMSGQL